MNFNYAQIKKLDEDTQKKLQEVSGPANECLCSLLAPAYEDQPRGIRGSIKRALASLGGRRGKSNGERDGTMTPNSFVIPISFNKENKGIFTTKEKLKRKPSCSKCGCDDKALMNTSYANIRIVTPDVSVICPCSGSACMPDKEKIKNISITVERMDLSDVKRDENNAEERNETMN